jgi:hypothetical protein
MPCYQSTSLPSGVTTTGRTSYATEAECNQACKEGACCEGTTCTVKPQCQCQCTSGSCCGPDTFTNSNGETGPRCRNESESACAARGGTWRCGVFCVGLQGDPFAGQPLGSGICTSLAGSPSTPVFKGVGTTCADGACECKCGCSASGAAPPDHIYATISGGTMWDGTYVLDRMAGGTATSPQDCFRKAGLNYAAFGSGFWPQLTGSQCCCSYSTLIAKRPGCESFSPPVGDQPWFLDNSAGGFIFAAPGGSWVTLPYSLREQGGASCCFSVFGNSLAGGSLPGLSSGGGYCSPSWSSSAGTQWATAVQMEIFNNIPCRRTGGFGYDGPMPVVVLHA